MGFWSNRRPASHSGSVTPVAASPSVPAVEMQGEDLCAVWHAASPSLRRRPASEAPERDLAPEYRDSRTSSPLTGRLRPLGMNPMALFRTLFMTPLTLFCLLYDLKYWPVPPMHWMLLLLLVPLCYLTRSLSVTPERMRPLTFLTPLVFGLTLWFGPLLAGAGAGVACLLFARVGSPTGTSRQRARAQITWQGAQLLVACCLSTATMGAIRNCIPYALSEKDASLLSLLVVTGGAASFVCCVALLHTLAYFSTLCANIERVAFRAHLAQLALVTTLGLLPILLLAPMLPMLPHINLLIGLPLLLLLLISSRLLRLNAEVESLRVQLRASEAMSRASIHDPQAVDASVLLQRFLALAHELVPSERSLVWILNSDTKQLSPEIALPDKGPFVRQVALYGEGLVGHAAARMAPRLVPDASQDAHRDLREHAVGAWLLYPIVVREQLLGVAHWTRSVSRPFSAEDVANLKSLVPQAAIALENVYIRAQMHDLAATDGLTGLWNQRRMADVLRGELRRAVRYHRTFSILMMDVDSFKTFNDTYGHPQGDQLLKTVARILRQSVRNVDYVGRYGGEEFLVIVPETGKDDACRLAERIRREIEENACLFIDGRPIRRTISIGVASYPEDALNPDELLQRADEALYHAKKSGKNRVIWA